MITTSIDRVTTPGVLTCSPDTPLSEAARRMMVAQCSSIFVQEGESVIGVWTEHDALGLDISQDLTLPISRHMTFPVQAVPARTNLGEVALRFHEEGRRHLLVVDESDSAWGVITQSDLVMAKDVSNAYLREVGTVRCQTARVIPCMMPLGEAVALMRAERVTAVVVQYPGEGELGIFTERDVIKVVADGVSFATVGDMASRPLASIAVSATLYQARKLFMDRRIRHLGVTDNDGRFLGLLSFSDILADIEHDYARELRATLNDREHQLKLSVQYQKLAEKAFESTFEGVMIGDANHKIGWINPAFTHITGLTAQEALGQDSSIFFSEKSMENLLSGMKTALSDTGYWQGELWGRKRTGEMTALWMTVNRVQDADQSSFHHISVFSDITHRKLAEERVHFMAYHDALTGLANRTMFSDRLDHALARTKRSRKKVAVLLIDLDHFKEVNDALGHPAGDRLLQVAAQRIGDCVREEDTVARLGGDEFAVILEGISHRGTVTDIAGKIVEALRKPALVEGHVARVTASVGAAVYPDDADTPEGLIRRADRLMYDAKSVGRDVFRMASS